MRISITRPLVARIGLAVVALAVVLPAAAGAVPHNIIFEGIDGPYAMAVCPAGDIENTVAFYMVDSLGHPLLGETPRVYFTNYEYPLAISFCGPQGPFRSQYFYPTNVGENHFTLTYSLGAGIALDPPSSNIAMVFEWGDNFQYSDSPRPNVSSPDLNGDLVVNLADLGEFAGIFSSGNYEYRADFNYDGVINLVDVGIFGEHYTHACQ